MSYHRKRADELLEAAQAHPLNSIARSSVLIEAAVQLILANAPEERSDAVQEAEARVTLGIPPNVDLVERPKPPEGPTLVVARNASQAETYRRNAGLAKKNFVYAGSPRAIEGLRPGAVVYVDGWSLNRSASEIEKSARRVAAMAPAEVHHVDIEGKGSVE